MVHVMHQPEHVINRVELFKKLKSEAPDFLGTLLKLEVPEADDRLRLPVVETPDKVAASELNEDAVKVVNKATKLGKRVCAVGTTSMRSIESSVSAESLLKTSEGWTNLFIYPPHKFHIADSMITNFHLPISIIN